jgi:hypothetical protein
MLYVSHPNKIPGGHTGRRQQDSDEEVEDEDSKNMGMGKGNCASGDEVCEQEAHCRFSSEVLSKEVK